MSATSTVPGWRPVAGAVFVAGWGAIQFAPLGVYYRTREHWNDMVVAAMFTTYVVGLVPGLVAGGPLAARFGRRPVVRPALLLAAAGSAVLALSVEAEALTFVSRLATGFAAGMILSAGSVWLQEISAASGSHAGGARSMYASGGGFAAGSLATGAMVEWLPEPMVLPALWHSALCVVVFAAARRVPETAPWHGGRTFRQLRPDGLLETFRHPRFLRVVLPASPAVFAAATVAYVVLPPLVIDRVQGYAPLFSGIATALTIGSGLAVQPLAARLHHTGSARLTLVAIATVILGLLVSALAVYRLSPVVVLVATVVLGTGYGLTLAAGLKELERLAPPTALPSATSLYQGAAYSGFVTPLLLAVSAGAASYPALLASLAAVGVLFLMMTAVYSRRHLPDA